MTIKEFLQRSDNPYFYLLLAQILLFISTGMHLGESLNQGRMVASSLQIGSLVYAIMALLKLFK